MIPDNDQSSTEGAFYRVLRRRLGQLAMAKAPRLTARMLGAPPPRKMPRLSLLAVQPDALAPHIKYMADTGEGTDACLAAGALPMAVHFYSPVPDIQDLKRRGVFKRRSALGGVDLRVERQLALLGELGASYGGECNWPSGPAPDQVSYVTSASGFSFGCAAALHMLIRNTKPKCVIEIGSGWSSRVINAALQFNCRDGAAAARYTIIDPFPGEALAALSCVTHVRPERAECIGSEAFEHLQAGDILFVDSGHTVRIGGDVNFIVLDVLPRLKPGVLIHFHDIPMPYEYDESYATNPKFRVFWTESYLLQAFLAFNSEFEVVLSMNYLMLDHPEAFAAALKAYNSRLHREVSHSFWIRRRH